VKNETSTSARLGMTFWKHRDFLAGLRDFGAVAPGLTAWGIMTGVAIVKSGMDTTAVLLMSTLVFAGSSQLAALPLIASGAPLWVVIATSFCVNLRFIVFSMHLRPYVMHHPLWRRLLGGYAMADLGYVLLVRRFPRVPTDADGVAAVDAYWAGVGTAGWVSWTGATLVGVVLGNNVPVAWGLGFAGILSLIGVTVSLISTRLRVVSATVATGAAIVAFALPFKLNILVAIAAAVVTCLVLEQTRGTHDRASPA
jgi:predicted branched-subunit amino acid permease